MKSSIYLVLALVACFANVQAWAENAKIRAEFEKVYSDVRKGKRVKTSHLKDYVLYPYLEYEQISQNLNNTTEKQLIAFIDNYKNSPLADKLWVHWLGRLVTKKQWLKIKSVYNPIAANTEARCHYLNALMYTGDKEFALNEAKALWMSGKSRPDACDAVFKALKANKGLSKADYWQRIELATIKSNSRLARSLVKYLPADEQKIAEQFILSHRKPKQALKSKHVGSGQYSRKVRAHAVKRIARKNYKKGYRVWREQKGKYPFTKAEKDVVESYLASRAALNHDTDAIKAFSRIPGEHRDDDANVWMARIALREGQWEMVKEAIESMEYEAANRDIWRYWKARAEKELGNNVEAERIFNELAHNATFYGFLSADALGTGYERLKNPAEDWEDCANNIQIVTPVARAMEWFKLGKDSLAYKEWFWALDHMNKDGVLAAAALALKLDKTILAVRTVAKTRDWNQIGLRFPMLYQKLITEIAAQNKITPAWVYGIMRRESIFNHEAVSSARAMGLMQLLPSTARYVGKKLGLGKVRKSDLFSPKLNIKLGSAYLSSMLKDFDGSYVKATAGYNAGPGRSVKWTPDKTIEADRWVESIPFTETRKYVRAVMAYTTIYDHKLHKGKAKRLSDRLPPVRARAIN